MASPYKDKPYTVTQRFGKTDFAAEPPLTWHGTYYERFHCGVDLTAGYQSPIYSILGGESVFAKGIDTDGAHYVITHKDDLYFAFWHLDSIAAPQIGTVMPVGTLLGYEGFTGNVYPKDQRGAHLHYEVQQKTPYGASLHSPNNPIDPQHHIGKTKQRAQHGHQRHTQVRIVMEVVDDCLIELWLDRHQQRGQQRQADDGSVENNGQRL